MFYYVGKSLEKLNLAYSEKFDNCVILLNYGGRNIMAKC